METIAEKCAAYESRTGHRVSYVKAYPLIGRGSVIHDWIAHNEAVRRFNRARSISPLQKLSWLLGGVAWK